MATTPPVGSCSRFGALCELPTTLEHQGKPLLFCRDCCEKHLAPKVREMVTLADLAEMTLIQVNKARDGDVPAAEAVAEWMMAMRDAGFQMKTVQDAITHADARAIIAAMERQVAQGRKDAARVVKTLRRHVDDA